MAKGKDDTHARGSLNRAVWCGFVGILFGVLFFIVTKSAFPNMPLEEGGRGFMVLRYSISIAAFFAGLILWWLFLSGMKSITLARGFWIGALIGVIALFTASFFELIYTSLLVSRTPSGQVLTASRLVGSLLRGVINTTNFGWLTIPAGGVCGGILSICQTRFFGLGKKSKTVKKSTLPLLKKLAITVGIIYTIAGVFMIRLNMKSYDSFHGWLYYWDGPYKGKVVDLETGKPIEGAVVAGSWHLEVNFGWPMFCDAVETITDKSGEFMLPKAWCINIWPLGRLSLPGDVILFKAGHLGYPPQGSSPSERRARMPNFTGQEFTDTNQYYIIELGKPTTREERLDTLHRAEDTLSFFDGYRRLPGLLDLVDKENRSLGLGEIPYKKGLRK